MEDRKLEPRVLWAGSCSEELKALSPGKESGGRDPVPGFPRACPVLPGRLLPFW